MPCPVTPLEKWTAYPETILEFVGGSVRVDLRQPLNDSSRTALSRLRLRPPFAVMTPENPCGRHAEDASSPEAEESLEARNDRRLAALEQELRELGVSPIRVDGVSPSGDYRERCLAWSTDRDEAVAAARRWDQLGLFWFDGRDFWLLPAEAERPARRLPELPNHANGANDTNTPT